MEDTEDSSDTQSSADELMTDALSPQENIVDSTVNTEQQGKESDHAARSTYLTLISELPQKQLVAFVSADQNYDLQEEVPDFSMSIEIADINICQRFEVSPEHSPGETTT